ncbi:hypothetical protein KEM55_008579, partial [Ascosphaera atra]
NSKALADFDRVLTIKPKFENALLQRGRLRAKNADWDGAKKDLKAAGQKAAEELAKIDDLRQAAIAAEKAEKRKDWGGCMEQASKAIEVATTSVDLRRRRAKCRFEIGEIYQGIGDLTHVLQLAAGDIEPYLHVSSMLFYSLAETEKGIDEARKCLRNDPDSKACSRMLRREKQIAKGIKQVYDFKDNGKYIKAIDLLVGKKGESGILADVKEEVQDARSAGHIHEKAPDELYTKLVDTTCELYRKVCLMLCIIEIVADADIIACSQTSREKPTSIALKLSSTTISLYLVYYGRQSRQLRRTNSITQSAF